MQFVLFILIIACLMVTAYSIKCYSCESSYDTGCSNDFDEEAYFKMDCSRTSPPRYLEDDLTNRNATACLKLVYKEQGAQKIIRSCFYGDVNDTDIGCRLDPMLVVDEYSCHVCEDYYCNDAKTIQQNVMKNFLWFLTAVVSVNRLQQFRNSI